MVIYVKNKKAYDKMMRVTDVLSESKADAYYKKNYNKIFGFR